MTVDRDQIELRPGGLLLSITILIVLLVALFWHFLVVQFQFVAFRPGDWGHTLLVPFATVYLAWIDRERLMRQSVRVSGTGFIVVGIGIGLYGLTVLGPGWLHLHNARSVGIAVTLCGIVLTLCGWSVLRVLWFPLLYLFVFGQFISPVALAPVTDRLQDVATVGSRFMFELLGYDTVRTGNLLVLETPTQSNAIDVAEACSGMRMLMAFIALGTLIAWSGLPLLWQRFLLIALAVPIALVVNIFRITMQGVLDSYDPELTIGAAHSFLSMLWLFPALLLFLSCQWFLAGFSPEAPADPSSEASTPGGIRWSPRAPVALGVLLGLLLLSALSIHGVAEYAGVHSIKKAVPLREPLETVSPSLGPWKRIGSDRLYSDTVADVLGTTTYLDRDYFLEDIGVLNLHVAHYTGGPSNRPHVPERCWSVHGLIETSAPFIVNYTDLLDEMPLGRRRNLVTDEPYRLIESTHPRTGLPRTLRVPVGELELMISLFVDPSEPGARLAGAYFFIANGQMTPSARGVRSLSYTLGVEHAFFTKVQLTLVADDPYLSEAEFLAAYEQLLRSIIPPLLPELLRVLPDWSQFEDQSVSQLDSD
ncbi:MAG: hypothetical protein CBC35_01985 [Planctomycetes bacterium TMED75]|nr:hypothetical protein [Planctomycetaceae bacterium]OUU95936.1 MAG: hypothetical protein CBC35_01985 [Planctomycetes bacterium TMED75]